MATMLRVPLTGGEPDPKLAATSKNTKKAVSVKPQAVSNVSYVPVPSTPGATPYPGLPGLPRNEKGPLMTGGTMSLSTAPPDLAKRLFIHDRRTINPSTGQAFKIKEPKSAKADPQVLSAIIAHAKAKGVDPYTALAIAQQESEFGTKGDLGQTLDYQPDPGLAEMYTTNSNSEANTLAKALKDKLEYAKRLGYDKKGLAYALQAYNGYGNGMDKDPKYGKVIVSLLENLKKNPDIQKMIDETPAYGSDTSNQKLLLKVAQK